MPWWPTRIDRYIGRTVLAASVLALLVFGVLNLIFAVADELGGTRGGYGAWQALQYVLLTSPRRVLESLPYVALVAALAGLGRLASASELVVMRAAGMSTRRIALACLLPTLPLMVLGLWLGETVVPPAERAADQLKAGARAEQVAALLPGAAGAGHWLRVQDTWAQVAALVVPAEPTEPVRLEGLRLYSMGPAGLTEVRTAASAAWVAGEGWRLAGVHSGRLAAGQLTLAETPDGWWRTAAGPRIIQAQLQVNPERLALTDLAFQAAWLEAQGAGGANYRLAFWRKTLMPLSVAALTLIGVSFIFGPLRETSMGARLAAGIGVGLVFKYLQDLLGPASLVYGFPPLLAVLVPVVLCLLAGMVLLRRAA